VIGAAPEGLKARGNSPGRFNPDIGIGWEGIPERQQKDFFYR
jgi:hypothetical protein